MQYVYCWLQHGSYCKSARANLGMMKSQPCWLHYKLQSSSHIHNVRESTLASTYSWNLTHLQNTSLNCWVKTNSNSAIFQITFTNMKCEIFFDLNKLNLASYVLPMSTNNTRLHLDNFWVITIQIPSSRKLSSCQYHKQK